MGTRGNAVPPKAFSVPSKKNSVPAKAISVPAKKTIAFPPKDFAFPPRKCAELHGTSSTTPPRNWAGKLLQLPPLSNTELHRLPPPLNRAGKLLQLPPPLEFTELHRLPPLEIGPENSFNYPPRFHGTSSTTSFVSGVGGTHWNAALKAFPL